MKNIIVQTQEIKDAKHAGEAKTLSKQIAEEEDWLEWGMNHLDTMRYHIWLGKSRAMYAIQELSHWKCRKVICWIYCAGQAWHHSRLNTLHLYGDEMVADNQGAESITSPIANPTPTQTNLTVT